MRDQVEAKTGYHHTGDNYRNVAYVEREVTKLARQLKEQANDVK